MTDLHDIATSLLDRDGSCRDVNFEHPVWCGVDDMIRRLRSTFKKIKVFDSGGNTINELAPGSVFSAAKNGFVQLVLEEGSDLIANLQVFVALEDDGTPFVELTFFPEDVKATSNLKRDFITWADEIRRLLRADRYFARYENASWEFGDLGPTSGVFLVSEHAKPNA